MYEDMNEANDQSLYNDMEETTQDPTYDDIPGQFIPFYASHGKYVLLLYITFFIRIQCRNPSKWRCSYDYGSKS